jgi:hypothetical protein
MIMIFQRSAAMRKNILGALESPVTVFWNIEKK